jgi:hypothetical protein
MCAREVFFYFFIWHWSSVFHKKKRFARNTPGTGRTYRTGHDFVSAGHFLLFSTLGTTGTVF